MALPTSGQISLSAIANNKESASLSNLSISTLSTQFASGSSVGDVDGNSTANQTADRSQLNSAPFAISEFRGAEFVNAFFDTVVAQLADGTVVTSNGYVDGESGRISFRVVDDSLGPNYSAGLKRASDNAVLVTQAASISGTGTKTISITAPSIDAATDAYYPFVTTGTFENAQGSNIDHFDAIGSVTITDPSDTTVANNSVTTNIEHQISITDDSSFNDINWTFAKIDGDGSVGTSTISNSSDRSPSVAYTGVGRFSIDCRVDGNPSQARNSSTATQVEHRIDFTKQITIDNPGNQNVGTNYNITGNHKGYSNGVGVSEVLASNGNILSSNNDTNDSRISGTAGNYSRSISPSTSGGVNTLSVKARASGGGVEALSNAYNLFPELRSNRNVINPNRSTIFSTTNNSDTSANPTSVTYSTPTAATDNVTSRQYSVNSLTGHTFQNSNATTHSAATTTYGGGTGVGNQTVKLDIAGNSSQTSRSTHNLTVNFAPAIFSVSNVTVGGDNDTVNDQLSFNFSNQGFNLQSTRFELMDASDGTTQRGNDFDSTSFTGGGAQSNNTENITLTSQASSFAHSVGGDFKIKISLFDNAGQSGTPIATALTNTFTTFSVTDQSEIIRGVRLLTAFFGYVDKLQAAENNSDTTGGVANSDIKDANASSELFSLNLNAGSLIATDNDLSTAFSPRNGITNAKFFLDSNTDKVIEVGDDGVIDSVRSATPDQPTIASSSFTTTSILIRITGNTEVARNFNTSITPSGGSPSTANTSVSSQASSHTQDITFSSLTPNTSHDIEVRGTNERFNGSFSSTVTVSTAALPTTFSNVPTLSVPFRKGTSMISDVFRITLANGSGNTTIALDNNVSSDLLKAQILVAASTSDSTPSSFSELNAANNGGQSTVSISHTTGDLFMAFKVNDNADNMTGGNDDNFNLVITNNSVSSNPSGVFREHIASSTDSATTTVFSNADITNSTLKLSDNMQISISGTTVGDTITFTAVRNTPSGTGGGEFTDITGIKFAARDGANTAAYDSSGTLASQASEVTVAHNDSETIQFTSDASGLKRYRLRCKANGDGNVNNVTFGGGIEQSGTMILKVTVANSSGNVITNQTLYTWTIEHNPFT